MKNLRESLGKLILESAVLMIGFYQKFFSPDHGMFWPLWGDFRCRFFPSCSEYAKRSIRQSGLMKGFVASLKRVARCNPWNEGGYDPV